MVVKAITKMKTGKAAGPSGIVAEMLKASGDTGARLVADLANDMVRNGVIPSEWEDSLQKTLNLFQFDFFCILKIHLRLIYEIT